VVVGRNLSGRGKRKKGFARGVGKKKKNNTKGLQTPAGLGGGDWRGEEGKTRKKVPDKQQGGRRKGRVP